MTTSASGGPRRTLEMSVEFLTGVGPRRAEALRRLNIFTARDLLFHVPHRYEDASTVAPIARLRVGDDATVIGTVISKGILPTRKGLRIFQAVVQDSSGMIEVGWPGQPWRGPAGRRYGVCPGLAPAPAGLAGGAGQPG